MADCKPSKERNPETGRCIISRKAETNTKVCFSSVPIIILVKPRLDIDISK